MSRKNPGRWVRPGLHAPVCAVAVAVALAVALALATTACLVRFDGGPEPSSCGNGRIDPGEVCDLADFGGKTCASEGFAQGELRCAPDCGSLDVSGCTGGCGDGLVQEGEQCDGTNLGGASCEGLGFAPGGSLTCEECRLDTSGCCGDGTVGGSEACDDGNAVDWDGCTGCQVSEIQANPNPEGGQGQPDIAVSPAGDIIAVVWADAVNGVMNGVWLRVFDGQGVPVTEAIPVSEAARQQALEHAYPSVGVGPEGTIWVVFQCDGGRDGSGWGIYLQAFDLEGIQLLQDDFQVNTRTQDNQQYPRSSVGRSGNVGVVWDQWNGSTGQHEVMFQRFSGEPNPGILLQERQEVLVYGDGDPEPTMPVVGVADDGGVLVAWQSQAGIYAVWGDANGTFSPRVRLDDLGGNLGPGQVSVPAVAVMTGADGISGGVVAWQHTSGDIDSPVYSIQAQAIQGDGSPLVGAFYEFTGTAAFGMKNPDVVLSGNVLGPEGRAWLLWTQTGGAAPLDYAQGVNPLQGGGDATVPLGMTGHYAQGRPRGAALTSGGFVAVWLATGQDGDNTGVFFQRFSAEGDPLGVAPAAP